MRVFQTPEFYKVLESSQGFEPFLIRTSSLGSNGYVQGYVTKDANFVKNLLSRRAIIHGNPIISDSSIEVLRDLLVKLKEKLENKAIYIEFRNLSNQQEVRTIYEEQGFIFEDHLDYYFDLSQSEEQLWKNIEPAKRNKIRKAEKNSFHFRASDSIEDMVKVFVLLSQLYKSIKLPLFARDYFLNLVSILRTNGSVKLFILEKDEKMLAFRLCLIYEGMIYDYYAAADLNSYKLHPNDLLPWEIFKWAKANGYHDYMFGGAGKPGVPYGVREFKKQYGGTQVNYGRFKLILNKPLYKIGEMGVKLMKKYG